MTTILDVIQYIEDDASLDECSYIAKSLGGRIENLDRNPLKEKTPEEISASIDKGMKDLAELNTLRKHGVLF